MKKKKYKFNYYRLTMTLLVIGVIVFFAVRYNNQKEYEKSNEYKLLNIGYKIEEIDELNKYLDNKQIDKIMEMKYNENIIGFIKEKYFLFNNLEKYLDYKKENKKRSFSDIIAVINTKANVDWVDNELESDTSKEELMIVNRLYSIGKYEPENLEDAPVSFAFNNIKLDANVLPAIEELIDDAKEAGYSFILSGGYRSYEDQENLYNRYEKSYGQREADNIVARPGHSEYQTGLTFDLTIYNKTYDKPEESDEYKWLIENAKNYGFILRHPKDKESLTGYNASLWKFRYVGEDVAKKMYKENICFEEYYAYYIEGGNSGK